MKAKTTENPYFMNLELDMTPEAKEFNIGTTSNALWDWVILSSKHLLVCDILVLCPPIGVGEVLAGQADTPSTFQYN